MINFTDRYNLLSSHENFYFEGVKIILFFELSKIFAFPYSNRIVLTGVILATRYDGPISIRSVMTRVPTFINSK